MTLQYSSPPKLPRGADVLEALDWNPARRDLIRSLAAVSLSVWLMGDAVCDQHDHYGRPGPCSWSGQISGPPIGPHSTTSACHTPSPCSACSRLVWNTRRAGRDCQRHSPVSGENVMIRSSAATSGEEFAPPQRVQLPVNGVTSRRWHRERPPLSTDRPMSRSATRCRVRPIGSPFDLPVVTDPDVPRCAGSNPARGGAHASDVRDPQLVHPRRREVTFHQVSRPSGLRRRPRRARGLVARQPTQPRLAHEPLDRAPGHEDALPVQLSPDLAPAQCQGPDPGFYYLT
ncbi:hypothetical protein BCF44_12924 [Kutzneria buriramensis]|uniref:Uncharacterized protein n=1 Tax=Kutzneria buriramensis TaxID=1045776 RepID=A0A3E0GVE5_9PSEU|nr:hypothetical protein BCF44_12924 [Kutzneria buriramensis]